MMKPCDSLIYNWFRVVHTYYFSRITLGSLLTKAGYNYSHINAHNNELWGIFYKIKEENTKNYNNVYHEQLKVIKKYKMRYFYLDIKEYIKHCITSLLPFESRNIIREKYLIIKNILQ